MTRRLEGAIRAVRDTLFAVTRLPADSYSIDDDLVDDLHLQPLELESVGLILESRFSLSVPDALWRSPLHRTCAALAEWCIAESDKCSWEELKRRRA